MSSSASFWVSSFGAASVQLLSLRFCCLCVLPRMTKGMSRQRQRVLPRQKSRLESRSRQSVFCVTGLSLSPNNYLSCLYLIFLGEESVTFL
ncbi:hypothetical protein V6N12_067901 [Hibiscus sabdariffa]|uniref:Secreted protein n=1 Tax=Hibiscus sabdariffa TaxID=183260 RepID=A0ABR2FNS1_9ROSI